MTPVTTPIAFDATTPGRGAGSSPQLPLAFTSGDAPSFASFLAATPAQRAAHQHLSGLAPLLSPLPGAADEAEATRAIARAPVYLWGPRGSGKTHLLLALAAAAAQRGGGVAWLGADACEAADPADDAAATLVVVDDAERLDAVQQQRAFVAFVEAGTRGAQFVAAGALPPVDLPLRDDLRSRLGWGEVFALDAPADAQVRTALQREAGRRGIRLGDEVLGWLLLRQARDLSSLMRLLDRLDVFSLAEKRQVTLPLVRQMLAAERQASPDAPA